MNKWMKKLTAALCAAQIHYDCLMPCIFSPIFHENTPVSSIIPESESISKFFDRLGGALRRCFDVRHGSHGLCRGR